MLNPVLRRLLVPGKSFFGNPDLGAYGAFVWSNKRNFGILVALRGITGDPVDRTSAHQIIAESLREQRRIVLLPHEDLRVLRDSSELVILIKTRLCDLVVTGTAL